MTLLENQTTAHPAAFESLIQLLFGKHITYAISAVARLGVPDHMAEVPVSVEDLARRTGAHAPSLYRVMRALTPVGVFEERAGRHFCLTEVGRLLQTDTPGSARYFAIQLGDSWSARSWERFTETVQTGEDCVTKAFGKNVFELFAEQPEEAATFQRSMTNLSAAVVDSLVDGYDFSPIQRLADVGGGHGLLLGSILNRHPGMQGVLYDLPEVIAGAPKQKRVQLQTGSFFERVPSGCDAYIMKFILHDWDDHHCRKILQLIRRELPEHGRVLICEQVITNGPDAAFAKFLDLEMLAMTAGGRERTASEFRDLLASAGLRLIEVVRTHGPLCILDARPE
jgi:hypothetical protein